MSSALLRKAQTEAGGHVGENESSRERLWKVSVNLEALVWRQEEIKGAESVAWERSLAYVKRKAKLRWLNVSDGLKLGRRKMRLTCGHSPELSQ